MSRPVFEVAAKIGLSRRIFKALEVFFSKAVRLTF
jgi:hypothetical protein